MTQRFSEGPRRDGDSGPQRAIFDLWVALAVLLATVTMCSRLQFDRDAVANGLSWFGIMRRTVVPFTIGLLLVAGLQVRAAAALPRTDDLTWLRRGLIASAVLMIGILATPYSVSMLVYRIHDAFGTALFGLQIGLATWHWRRQRQRERLVGGLLLVQLTAGLAALGALLGLAHDMFFPQVIYQLAYGVQLPFVVRDLAGQGVVDRRRTA